MSRCVLRFERSQVGANHTQRGVLERRAIVRRRRGMCVPLLSPTQPHPRDKCRTRATPRGARRVPASRARRGPKRPRAIVKIFFPEARRFAFPKWTHRVFSTRQSPRDADPTSPFPHVAKKKTNAHELNTPHPTLRCAAADPPFQEITMPALSPTMTQGSVAEWKVEAGAKVSAGDVIADIETDKATMALESMEDGTSRRSSCPRARRTYRWARWSPSWSRRQSTARSSLTTCPPREPPPPPPPPPPPRPPHPRRPRCLQPLPPRLRLRLPARPPARGSSPAPGRARWRRRRASRSNASRAPARTAAS